MQRSFYPSSMSENLADNSSTVTCLLFNTAFSQSSSEAYDGRSDRRLSSQHLCPWPNFRYQRRDIFSTTVPFPCTSQMFLQASAVIYQTMPNLVLATRQVGPSTI